jgi:hypothetical protein
MILFRLLSVFFNTFSGFHVNYAPILIDEGDIFPSSNGWHSERPVKAFQYRGE